MSKKLTKKEKVHVLNILLVDNDNYTKNTNGYFFNLSHINNETLQKIDDILNLIEKKELAI